jgi:hypothetical protein
VNIKFASVLSALALAAVPAAFAHGGGGSHGGGHASSGARASSSYHADHSVRGYSKRDGTYVSPHHATNRNSTKHDNYSTKGNANPYTGKEGTKSDI